MSRLTALAGRVLMFVLFTVCYLLGGLALLGWQVVTWLSRGEWVSVSVADALARHLGPTSWAAQPTSWLGLWRVLDWLPMSLTAVVIGTLGTWAAVQDD